MADKELASKLAARLALEKEKEEGKEGEKEGAREGEGEGKAPPPPPVMPVKIVENPFVATDDSFSIDDMIEKTLQKQEQNNNLPAISPTPPTQASSSQATPTQGTPLSPPPRTTIRDLLIKEHQHDPSNTQAQPKCPIVHVVRGDRNGPAAKREEPEGAVPKGAESELERRLAEQRHKHQTTAVDDITTQKGAGAVGATPTIHASDGTELERRLAEQRRKKTESVEIMGTNQGVGTSIEAEPVVVIDTTTSGNANTDQETVGTSQGGNVPASGNEPIVEEPERKSSFEELEELFQKEAELLLESTNQKKTDVSKEEVIKEEQKEVVVEHQEEKVEERKENEKEEKSMEKIGETIEQKKEEKKDEGVGPSPTVTMEEKREEKEEGKNEGEMTVKTDDAPPQTTPLSSPPIGSPRMGGASEGRSLVPSPQLMEMIRKESGIKSPPPIPPPKPATPTHSRPQSPVVLVRPPLPLSPLGLLCDPLMSVEKEAEPSTKKTEKKPVSPSENPDELAALLERRNKINEGDVVPQFVNRKLSIYAEFSEFTRKQIKFFSDTFTKYDEDKDGFIDFNELKRMMEKLGEAQTHIALKQIIQKVDEDKDGKISMREFLLLFRMAAEGHFGCSEVFTQLAQSVDVTKEGVLGAANFFQAKIAEQTKLTKFEEEIKQEQDEKKKEEEEKKQRREKFLQSKSLFH